MRTTGGVLLADVRPGSPADQAGIHGGDRIVDIGGTRIENLYDMTYALQDHKPGDTVDVIVIRNGEQMTLRATLTHARRRRGAGGSRARNAARSIKARQAVREDVRRREALHGHSPAHVRRRERRGVFQPRRDEDHLPVDAAAARGAIRST